MGANDVPGVFMGVERSNFGICAVELDILGVLLDRDIKRMRGGLVTTRL